MAERFTWFKKWDLLPEELQANFDVPYPCATPVVIEIYRNYDQLNEIDREWLAREAGMTDLPSILARPDLYFTQESSLYPQRLHYE